MRAPAPDWRKQAEERERALPPGRRTKKDGSPGDQAPFIVLLRFWSENGDSNARPSETVRKRLLEACEKHPKDLLPVLTLLPDTSEAHDLVKRLLDGPGAVRCGPRWRERVRRWLMLHSRYFREDLVRAASKAGFEEGWLDGETELRALAEMDWKAARPVLERHLAGSDLRVSAFALRLTYEHAVKTNDEQAASALRAKLKAIVQNRAAPGFARNCACVSLLTTEWPGRGQWYLSLFGDETVRDLRDGHVLHHPLSMPVAWEPDEWIPVVTKLVGHENRAVHDAAVSCLIQFQLDRARADALQPLLPWLSDPDWSSCDDIDRLRLIQSLDRIDLPESVPGLIRVAERETGYHLSGAAEALAYYRAKEAVPALKKALARETAEHHRYKVASALVTCGGLSDDETASAIEAYAVQLSTPEGQEELYAAAYSILGETPLPAAVSLGYILSLPEYGREDAAVKLIARAEALAKQKPRVAKELLSMVASWPVPAANRHSLRRIAEGRADAEVIRAMLDRRDTLKTVADELRSLAESGGTAGGIASVMLGDHGLMEETLAGTDREAQRALLACARLVRAPLPVDRVGVLLGAGLANLALAAERYLESEDGPLARQLVLARYPGEIRILGARQDSDPGHFSFGRFDGIENGLREDMRRAGGPDEIYALLSFSYWGGRGDLIVHVYGRRANLFIRGGDGRRSGRALDEDEWEELLAFMEEHKVDDLAPLNIMVHDGVQYEYVHLTRAGGRRVFMNNPGSAGTAGSLYERLVGMFLKLSEPAGPGP